MLIRNVVASILVSGLLAASTSAQQGVEFTVQGVLGTPFCTQVNLPPPWEAAFCGVPFSITVCFDPAAEDSDPSSSTGVYADAVTSMSVDIGGVVVTEDPPLGRIRVLNNVYAGGNDGFFVDFQLSNGWSGDIRTSTLVGNGVISDDALPDCDTLFAFSPPGASSALFDGGTLSFAPITACGSCDLPECFLVIGNGPGSDAFTALDHEFTTQVSDVHQIVPVLMDDIPEFVIWEPLLPVNARGLGLGAGVAGGPGQATPQVFFAQVLMWNPQLFPGNPEQSTQGLAVVVWPNGAVVTVPYGTSDGGMAIWAEIDWNDEGQKVLRLPFDIAGL